MKPFQYITRDTAKRLTAAEYSAFRQYLRTEYGYSIDDFCGSKDWAPYNGEAILILYSDDEGVDLMWTMTDSEDHTTEFTYEQIIECITKENMS